MKRLLILLITMLLAIGAAGIAGATVIDFDDITSDNFVPIPSDYQGFTWDSNFYIISDDFYVGNYGNSYGPPSDGYAALNGYADNFLSLASGEDFNFIGAWFAAWTIDDEFNGYTATALTIRGYNNGAEVGSVSLDLLAPGLGYHWFDVDLMGIDSLLFEASGSDLPFWLMDDFTHQAVPEPVTLLLFGSGLAGLAGLRKKKFF